MDLVPYKTVNIVLLCETFDQLVFVLVYSSHKGGSHTGIKRTISFAAKNINKK